MCKCANVQILIDNYRDSLFLIYAFAPHLTPRHAFYHLRICTSTHLHICTFHYISSMKKSIILLSICIATFTGCKTNWELPNEYVGNWTSAKQAIIVRTYAFGDGFTFTKDSAVVKITIDKNKTASGSIGDASFNHANIKRNKVNTDLAGIAYIIECGDIGKIYTGDPLAKKEVQLWLLPIKNGSLEAELRYTEGWAVFPMAGLKLLKK